MLFSIEVIPQQFHFKLDKSIENELFDVIETDTTYEFVGTQFTLSNRRPYTMSLSKSGAILNDSIFNYTDRSTFGGIANSNNYQIKVSSTLPTPLLSGKNSQLYFESVNGLNNDFSIEFSDTTKQLLIENLKVLNDTLLFSMGFYADTVRFRNAFMWIINLNDTSQQFIDFSSNQISLVGFVSDIISYKDKFIASTYGVLDGDPNNWGGSAEIVLLNQSFQIDTVFNISFSQNTFNRNFVGFFTSLVQLDDNRFMIASKAANSRGISHAKPEDMVSIVLDSNFNEVALNFYGLRDSSAEQANQCLSRFEGDPYVYIGGTENYKVDFSGYPSDTTLFILTKADLMGNEIWTRYYSNNTNLFMRKVLATSDGGALMVGWSYDPAGPDGFEKDVWIVKVDSNGNYLPTSIKEQQISKSDFNFYPNPLKNELHFRQINALRNYQFELFDVSGRKVAEEELINSDETINTSHLKFGTYIYHLIDQNGNYATGKLIKE